MRPALSRVKNPSADAAIAPAMIAFPALISVISLVALQRGARCVYSYQPGVNFQVGFPEAWPNL
jgi:hypothetical protein